MVRDQDAKDVAERFRTALDMYAFGEALLRQRIIREHPELDGDEIEARLKDWLRARPGAEAGDAVGRTGRWPRTPVP